MPRQYNWHNHMDGGRTTDAELIKTLGLDPALEGTPQINDAIVSQSYDENMYAEKRMHMKHGYSPEKADSMAKSESDKQRAAAMRAGKKIMKIRGY